MFKYKPDQQGLSSSIRLEVGNLRTQLWQTPTLMLTVILRLQLHYHDNQIMISNRDNGLHYEQTLSDAITFRFVSLAFDDGRTVDSSPWPS